MDLNMDPPPQRSYFCSPKVTNRSLNWTGCPIYVTNDGCFLSLMLATPTSTVWGHDIIGGCPEPEPWRQEKLPGRNLKQNQAGMGLGTGGQVLLASNIRPSGEMAHSKIQQKELQTLLLRLLFTILLLNVNGCCVGIK